MTSYVGWSESRALPVRQRPGESQSYGDPTNYLMVTHALANDGYSFTASNEPTNGQFFVTSAESEGSWPDQRH